MPRRARYIISRGSRTRGGELDLLSATDTTKKPYMRGYKKTFRVGGGRRATWRTLGGEYFKIRKLK